VSHKHLNPVNADHPKRVAIVLSNPGTSTTTGWPVGFWWAELSHPYFQFTGAGYQVELFSPNGGECLADAMSDPEDASQWQAEDVMPWRIEDELKALGANYVQAGLWRGFAIRDGNLVTGQQNFSGGETAQLIVETLGR
jgi:putative intracellular protease/amidase